MADEVHIGGHVHPGCPVCKSRHAGVSGRFVSAYHQYGTTLDTSKTLEEYRLDCRDIHVNVVT